LALLWQHKKAILKVMKNIEKYTKFTLDNGLRLVIIPDSSREVVTTMAVFGVGSRYEEDRIAGISHVLEHMLYKGTTQRPTSTLISEFIEDIGGEHNAFTSKEYTGYYAKVASKYLERSIDFVSDLVLNPLFPEEEFEQEKQVILQELKMYEDLPMEVASSKFEEALLGSNNLGRDVIGYEKSIVSLTREDLVNYHHDNYTAANGIVVLAGNIGDITLDEAKALVQRYFTLPEGEETLCPDTNLNTSKAIKLVEKQTEQSNVIIGFRGAGYNNKDKYALKLLAMILGGSMSSRMFTEIREKKGLAYAVRTSSSSYQDIGVIETYAGVPHERVSEAIEAILREYHRVFEDLTEAEVRRAKEIVYGRMLISEEDTSEVATHFALQSVMGKEILSVKEISIILEKITRDDIINIGRKYLIESNLALGFVGQNFSKEKAEEILRF
jgi:predicted Zn-dependent peptidase